MSTPATSLQTIINFFLKADDNYDASYRNALAAKNNWFPRMGRKVTVPDISARFPFSFNTVGMKEKPLGSAVTFENILAQNVNITVREWGDGVQMWVNQFNSPVIQDMTMNQINTLALNWAFAPLYRFCHALRNGDTDPYYVSYDGQQIFSQTHTVGNPGITWSNLFTGTLYDPNNVGETLNEIMTNMMQIPWGPDGKYLPTSGAQWILLVPPKQALAARKLVENSWYLQNNLVGDNPFNGIAEVIVEENLVTVDDPDNLDWYLIMVLPTLGIQPAVWLEQDIPFNGSLISNIDPSSVNMFHLKMLQWKLEGWMEVFPGQFFLMSKILQASSS